MMISSTDLIIFLAVLAAVNLVVFIVFAGDKGAARKNLLRTSERTLIILAFFGPFGAYWAMKIFRHKTHKITFYCVPLFAILQIVLLTGALIYYLK